MLQYVLCLIGDSSSTLPIWTTPIVFETFDFSVTKVTGIFYTSLYARLDVVQITNDFVCFCLLGCYERSVKIVPFLRALFQVLC